MILVKPDPDIHEGFQEQLRRYASYKVPLTMQNRLESFSPPTRQAIEREIETGRPGAEASLLYLDTLDDGEMRTRFQEVAQSQHFFSMIADKPETLDDGKIEAIGFPLYMIANWWLEDYNQYKQDKGDKREMRQAERRIATARTGLISVHSSMPVYDIGETIARGLFQVLPGDAFPTAVIMGGTKGKLELVPFWDAENRRPITPQRIGLIQRTDENEFSKLKDQAIEIATGYSEEMATYFYAMDAYWLKHAKKADDYVEMRIEDLMQYTGKKPVKSAGSYTNTYRPDQIRRAGQMVYGLGFTMVEIEKTVVRGKGTRTHYKRLWEVEDAYSMQTLDGETWLESIRYRPCEIFRDATFGTRRETALLMSRVLALDFTKMIAARRLGRYYTWLWRDRAYRGRLDAPISCDTLLSRAGIEITPGKEYNARKALETALDRLETEGVIAEWLITDENGVPVDTGERISFDKWRALRISITPPSSIQAHYAANLLASPEPAATENIAQDDIERLRTAVARSKLSLREAAREIGIDTATLSRILTGKTRKPQAKAGMAIIRWLDGMKE